MKNAGRSCSVDGCDQTAQSKGYCGLHYGRARAGKPVDIPGKPRLGDFWDYVDTSGDCWLWIGSRGTYGYGRFKGEPASRVALRLAGEDVPPGAFVLHSCDNPPCVNPAHLRPGTPADNMRDRSEHGRSPMGRAAGAWKKSVLTEEDVRAIRSDPRSTRKLAPLYGVSAQTISDIRRGRSWRWVT